jgi:hypothetical protein
MKDLWTMAAIFLRYLVTLRRSVNPPPARYPNQAEDPYPYRASTRDLGARHQSYLHDGNVAWRRQSRVTCGLLIAGFDDTVLRMQVVG